MEKFVAIALAPEGLLSNSSLLHTAHSTHRLLAYRAPCAATTSPAQAAGKCGHHEYGSKLCLVFPPKCECYVVVGNANVSATTHLGSTNKFEKSFHARFQLRIQRYGQIFPHARNALAGSNLTPTKKKRSHSPQWFCMMESLCLWFYSGMESPCSSLTEKKELFLSWTCFGNSAPSHAFVPCCPKLYLQTWTPKSGLSCIEYPLH